MNIKKHTYIRMKEFLDKQIQMQEEKHV